MYKKGNIAWNKGTKGICKTNKTSFKKGQIPWVKGKKFPYKPCPKKKGKHYSPKTEFKKGCKSERKGKKYPQFSGDKNPSWKGGKFERSGYIYIYMPEHPFAKQRYVKRANLVMEKHLGRYLTYKEVIHHINGIRNDDRPENLMLFANNSKHRSFHFSIKSLPRRNTRL